MSQFEFSTKEEREAWRVLKPLLCTFWQGLWPNLDKAASRFDAREKTCGIEFGSYEYGLLTIAQHVGLNQFNLRMPTLDRFLTKEHGFLNDEGREVLAHVNAMCKVSK